MNKGTVLKSKLKQFTYEYCRQTTLHGFHYIINTKTILKTASWILICFSCLVFCFYLSYLQLVRFSGNPTNTFVASSAFPVWEDPFPAVTICSDYIILKNNTWNSTSILENAGFSNRDINGFYTHLTKLLMCKHCVSKPFVEGELERIESIFKVLKNSTYTVDRLMQELSIPCENILEKCIWKSREVSCKLLFKKIKTRNGFCCSFNYYGSKEVQTTLTKEENLRFYTVGGSRFFGLKVLLKYDSAEYLGDLDSSKGFDVSIRDGYDYPDMSVSSYQLLVGNSLTLALSPSVLHSDKDLKSVTESKKECWFGDEHQLECSNIYTYQNCIMECQAKAMLDLCGCIPYYYPVPWNICTIAQTDCILQNDIKFNSLLLVTPLAKGTSKLAKKRVGNGIKCHCLATCDELKFETSTKNFAVPFLQERNFSELNIFYNTIVAVKRGRSTTVSWDMLLAAMGGIFGLCLGGSVLSIIELVYHIFDALFGRIKIYSEQNDDDLDNNLNYKSENVSHRGSLMLTQNLNPFFGQNFTPLKAISYKI